MTAMTWPDHLLTLEEYEQLPQDKSRHYELQEGVLQVTPRAASLHQRVVKRLTLLLDEQLADEWEAVSDIEVVLVPTWPPTLRAPDVLVASTALVDQNPARLHAQDVLLAVEVISPGSRETDRIVKLHEYAKAGIPAYWVLDLGDPVTLSEHRLADGLYKTHFDGSEIFYTGYPFELRVDLDEVVRRPRRR